MSELETVPVSIGPENGIAIRGWMLKPSSVSSTATSAQSDGNDAQFGVGRLTRRPVTCVASLTVLRLLGNGWSACVFANAVAGNASTIAAITTARTMWGMRVTLSARGELSRRRYSGLDSRVHLGTVVS